MASSGADAGTVGAVDRAERGDPFAGYSRDGSYSIFARVRRQSPVVYSAVFRAWVVTRYEDVREVLLHPGIFSSANAIRPLISLCPEAMEELRKGYPNAVSQLNTDGAAHRRLRAPLAHALIPGRVRELEPLVRDQVEHLVDGMIAAGRAEFMSDFARELPLRVVSHILGIAPEERAAVGRGSRVSSQLFRRGDLTEAEQVEHARQLVAFQRLMLSYAAARRAEPRDDLITRIVAALAPGSGPLTAEQESELAWSLTGILGAGTMSTSSTLGSGLYYLLSDRGCWERLVARPGLIGNAVEEICRYDTPVQTSSRVTTRPVRLGGVELPAGAEVIVLHGSANRDETLLDRPDVFDITRPRTRHLTFGLGVHACVGAPLARTELRIALQTLTRRLPGLRLADEDTAGIAPQVNHRQPTSLELVW